MTLEELTYLLKIHKHTGVDLTQQLPSSASTTHVGLVASNVASTPFPSGYSVSHLATGEYKITHNLGHTNYVIFCTPISHVFTPEISAFTSNDITVYFWDVSSHLQDTDFQFAIITT